MVPAALMERLRNKSLLIFDFDGTVADTSPLHAQAFQEVLAPYGVVVDYGRIAGLTTFDAIRTCLENSAVRIDDSELSFLVKAKQSRVREMIKNGLTPLPGMDDFLRWARRNYRVAMVTSGSRATVGMSLTVLGYESWFDPLICAEDVSVSKPAPEGFLKACALAECSPDHAIVFEDSISGVQAALAAGIECWDVSRNQISSQFNCLGQVE